MITNRIAGWITALALIVWIVAWIFIVIFCCYGCSVGFPATCSDLSLVEASVARSNGYDTIIVVGRDSDGVFHATGQAFVGNKWVDLKYWNGEVILSDCANEIQEAIKAYDLPTYAAKRRKFVVDLKGEE